MANNVFLHMATGYLMQIYLSQKHFITTMVGQLQSLQFIRQLDLENQIQMATEYYPLRKNHSFRLDGSMVAFFYQKMIFLNILALIQSCLKENHQNQRQKIKIYLRLSMMVSGNVWTQEEIIVCWKNYLKRATLHGKKNKLMRVLITGASGLLGGRLIDFLFKQNKYILSMLTRDSKENNYLKKYCLLYTSPSPRD